MYSTYFMSVICNTTDNFAVNQLRKFTVKGFTMNQLILSETESVHPAV